MTQAHLLPPPASRPVLFTTPWPDCAGLRAGAIDSAAALIVIEILLDALAHMPQGQAALAEARQRHPRLQPHEQILGEPLDLAAAALALALIEAADDLDEKNVLAA